MGAGPVIPASADGGWTLGPAHAAMTQGIVVSPFAHLPEACALFLQLPPGGGSAWLAAVRAACPVTRADGRVSPACAMAFTWTGLQAMGLGEATLATFSAPFREGMHQIDRQRRLGDTGLPDIVIAGGPAWSGNTPDPFAQPGETRATPVTVHAVLLLYGEDAAALAALVAQAEAALGAGGVQVSHRLDLSLRFDAMERAREHFGFADGVSQPVPYGVPVASKCGGEVPRDPVNAIAAGDILMGHGNAQGEPAPGPMVAQALDPAGLLTRQGAPEGFCNFGLNGSYLVLRELRQDVAAFWNSMYRAMGTDNPDEAIWLASRVVGRTMDGDMLIPGGARPPAGGDPANDFTFFADDPQGMGCPVGSHVRRAFPRDGLAPYASAAPDLLRAACNHRILRRGRKFGPTIADPRKDDGATRGLLFAALNTDLVRQFEFIQQTWLLNPNFGTLLNETDPLLGPPGRFTIPDVPLRRRPAVEAFVRFAGGEYFFLPSLPALDYLQSLPVGAAL